MRVSFEAIVRDADGRTFGVPAIELDGEPPFHHVALVNAAVTELCGAPVTTLRCLGSEQTPDDGRRRRYELEAHGPVRGLPEVEVELLPPGNPWEEPGWFAQASAWIRERVDAPVEQRSTGSISAFLRAGDAYFKAVPWFFAAEPAITAGLSREHPGRMPEVLDIDTERGWLLTRDFGDERLAAAPPSAWVEAFEAYAEVQLAWVAREDDLFAFGCPDRTLPRLEEELDVVLADLDAMLPGREEGLSDEQLGALPELRARMHETIARIAALGIPPTLDHGDLHAENIAIVDGGALLFDWSDGCLACPLVSLAPAMLWDEQPQGTLDAVRDAYFRRIDAPVEAFHDALVVGLAHQAVSYHRITAGTAPHSRWQWEQVLPWIVKQLLER